MNLLESAVLPPTIKKKRPDDDDEKRGSANPGVMNFTVITKRGNKQQVCFFILSLMFPEKCCVDASNRRPFRVGSCGSYPISATSRQGRTTTPQEACSGLRAARRSRRVERCVDYLRRLF